MSESRTENHDLTGSAREIWVVSESCSNVDGILVRSGPDLNSDVLGRLAPGARVQADPPTAGRVHYTLISGAPESPKIGWVSLRANGKDLILKEVVTEDAKAKESLPSKNALALANSVGAEESVHWEVTGTKAEGLLVRTGASLSSEMLSRRLAKGATLRQIELDQAGGRLHYELLKGEGPKIGWVSLHASGHQLVRRIPKDPKVKPGQPKTSEVMLHTDYSGIPRGACTGCRECQLWQFETMSSVEWGGPDTNTTIEDRRQSYDRKMRGYQEKRKGISASCSCGCAAELHLDLSGWLDAVRTAARPFRETYEVAIRKDPAYRHLGRAIGTAKPRRLPRVAQIPAAALQWSHEEVAMFLLSLGVYDPRNDGTKGDASGIRGTRVSVICPTSEKRHAFHPLLYQSFTSQSYEEKELVVVDTGSRPSSFFLAKAAEDSRVIYRHFHVDDSRENDPMSAVILNDGFNMLTGEDVKKRRGLSFKPTSGWSLGFKRNLCCHLAHGPIIAHFDDDDLYASCYLQHMCHALQRGTASLDRPLACTLAEWHMMDVKDQSFGFFSPNREPLLEHEQRESFQYGYGFSFVYTKAAWELVKFPDTEWSEDGDFMGRLQLKKVPIELVRSGDAFPLAAHTHHSDSTSGGELYGNVRLGYAVPSPEAFQQLLPTVRRVAADSRVGLGAQHPLRAEMHRVLDGYGYPPTEIRWHEKEQFFKRNPNFGRPVATPQQKSWYQEWQPPSTWRGNQIGFGF